MACIFCKIVLREVPANIVYEDDYVCGFHDINPVAPAHIVIIPKEHIARIDAPGAERIAEHVVIAINALAHKLGLSEAGFRVVSNAGADGGQTIDHLHFHLIGGRRLQWPPG